MESSKSKKLGEVEEKIGYKFNNSNLLKEALTHHSYQEIVGHGEKIVDGTGKLSYERLEYIGDSVLNLLMAREDFLLYPHLKPGMLTRLRSANVDTEKLARVALRHNLQNYLLHNMPLLSGQIEEFTNAISNYPLRSNGLIDPPKVLADIVESIIGAIYIDCNFSMEIVWKVVKILVQPTVTPETLEIHPMTKLYEICQKHNLVVKIIDLWTEKGQIEVFINDEFAGRGEYRSKKTIALNRAANNAYNHIMETKYFMEDNTDIDGVFNISRLFLEETKKSNDDEDAKDDLYSLVTIVEIPPEDLKGLGTNVIDDVD